MICVWCCWLGGAAYLIRFNFSIQVVEWSPLLQILPMVVFWATGLHRGLWRFTSIPDLGGIIRAVVLGALAVSLALFLLNRLEGVPRATLVLYPVFLVLLLGAPRLVYRMWRNRNRAAYSASVGNRVLILGAAAPEKCWRAIRFILSPTGS